MLAADSPMLDLRDARAVRAAPACPQLVGGYLGEPAADLGAEDDAAQGRAVASPGAWHQDGAFMGDVRALNLWLSLSRCGDEAPGLDIVPRRLDQLVATGTDEAMLDYQVSQAQGRGGGRRQARSSGRSSSPATRCSSTSCSCTRPAPTRRCRTRASRSRAGSSAARRSRPTTPRSRSSGVRAS